MQSVLIRPQGLRLGLYAPTCPPYATVCKILYIISNWLILFSFTQSFVIVLTLIDSCTCKCNYCSFNTIYCYL